MIENQSIFITGGAGFIASHIVEQLIDKNKITVYDNLERNALKYSSFKDHKNLTFIQGDVLDQNKIKESIGDARTVIHAAAIAGIYSVGVNLTKTLKVNLLGTYNVLEASLAKKVDKIIDFSTSEVYGPFVYRGKEDDRTTQGPVKERRWIYAVSKLAGEHMAHAYGHDFGMNITTVRPFNVYGPRQIGEGAIQQMVNRALKNEDLTVFNDGTQIRSWCYVSDFVDAILLALQTSKSSGEVFNIGNPQATTTVLGLAEKIIEMTKSKSKIVFKAHPGPEVEMRVPDIEKAKTLLNYEPKYSLDKGLGLAIEWYSQNL